MLFSEEYFRLFEKVAAFRDRVAQKYLLTSDTARVSERLLRCIWYDRLYDERRLTTRDERTIAVHSPGTWNLEGGPDFKNADLTIGNRRVKGDVELHVNPASWRLHGHSLDPRYDNVILHVTLTSRGRRQPVMSRHGAEIPETVLWDCLTDDLKILRCALRPEEYPYRSMRNFGKCRGLLEQMPPEVSLRLLHIAGDARVIAKQRRFAYERERQDLDQVAYAAVLEGMGYKAYTRQFGQLAQKLPYAPLRERVLSSSTTRRVDDGVRLTQALLLGAAGLLRHSGAKESPKAQRYFGGLRTLWRGHGFKNLSGDDIIWKGSAVRPANLPQRRIAGISHVLARSYENGLFKSILACVSKGHARETRTACIEYLTRGEDDFWSHRYSASGKRLRKPVSLVGRDRALTIVVNAFVPLALFHARLEGHDEEEQAVHQLYSTLPSLPPNSITRLMEYRMFGGSPKKRMARSARAQQGLLQIFADWCSEDPSCEKCGIFAGLQSGNVRDSAPGD
ncbi:MAG: DUF2851 family protein [Candidatus Hydrogenedentota bacterium]|nr:MAG: DUF2851 family protein [Candidatus Hydrogenedentota bacterium]